MPLDKKLEKFLTVKGMNLLTVLFNEYPDLEIPSECFMEVFSCVAQLTYYLEKFSLKKEEVSD
jgi:hypothetical protein